MKMTNFGFSLDICTLLMSPSKSCVIGIKITLHIGSSDHGFHMSTHVNMI